MSYKYTVGLTNISIIDKDYVFVVYDAMRLINTGKKNNGKAHNGCTYLKNGGIVFQSNNQWNVFQASKNESWDTKLRFKLVEPGSTIYIVPTNPTIGDFGLKATAVSELIAINTTSHSNKWMVDSDESEDGTIIMLSEVA